MSSNMVLEGPPAVTITEAEVAGFAAKLEAWYETLPPGEQAVLQRLLDCVEGMALEECDVAGYAVPGIGAKLTRIFAAGLMTAALAAPLAASAAPRFSVPGSAVTAQITQTPEDAILTKALALGASFTGSALAGLETVPNGFRIRYQKCDIYHSPAAGTYEIHGPIRDTYDSAGGSFGHLGLPRTDELVTSDGVGRYNELAGDASIYRSPNTGAFLVEGDMRRVWVANDAERRLGYPTAAVQYQNGGRWQDFQNEVLYFEGSQLRAPAVAILQPEQLKSALVNFFGRGYVEGGYSVFHDGSHIIDSFEISGVSNTGYDFSQSRNRLVTLHIEGHLQASLLILPSPANFLIDLQMLFFAQKEADGSTSLRAALYDHSGYTAGSDVKDLAEWLDRRFVQPFNGRPKLINVTIPAAVPVLSFKVMEGGRIKLFLQPGGGTPGVQQAVQLAFDQLAQ